MATIQLTLSETKIKEHQLGNSFELKDNKAPIRLRFHKSRKTASWYIVYNKNNKTLWHKVGNWPLLSVKMLRNQIPDIVANLAAGQVLKNVTVNHFETVNQVLNWYKERSRNDANLSQYRKANIKTAIDKHLCPAFKGVSLKNMTGRLVDEALLRPKQLEYKITTVKSFFNILKVAFNQASKVNVINTNPLSEIKFTDSISAAIKPKQGLLKSSDIQGLMTKLDGSPTMAKVLVFMMINHGTRIGETRLAKWKDIDLNTMTWHIPAENNKPKREHSIPITNELAEYLQLHRNELKRFYYTGDFIFPSTLRRSKEGRPISTNQANTLIKEISKGEWTSHDLRKLAASAWEERNEDYLIIKFLLNHHIEGINKAYLQGYIEPRKRDLINRWQAFLTEKKTTTIQQWV